MSKSELVHVVMLPWLAFGHLIPFLKVAIALARSGIHISFVSTPKNIERLPKIVPPNLSNLIQFIPFPLPNPAADPLPENAESTNDVPPHKMDALRIAGDLLQQPIKNFIAQTSPNWILIDFFAHWAADISREFNIPLVKFFVTPACSASFFWMSQLQAPSPRDLTAPPHWVDFPSKAAYRKHEVAAIEKVLYRANSSGISDGGRMMKGNQASDAIILRTSPELEAEYLNVLSNLTGKRVFPLGFLPPEKPKGGESEAACGSIFRWLDEQERGSVVFVAFGSESHISKELVHEIAYGLELSGLPFLWALRRPKLDAEEEDDGLPPGFCERTAAQGLVNLGWVPQLEIVDHPSVGGMMVHAGWSSIVEAMQFGHALVLLPLAADQPLNARMMAEEKHLAVEVQRAEDGTFTRNEVAAALTKAMLSDDDMRARAQSASRHIFGSDHVNAKYIDKFAQYLKNPNIANA